MLVRPTLLLSPRRLSTICMRMAGGTTVTVTDDAPNDEEENDRLDMVHEMMLVLLDRKLFLAPIGSSPGRVLDIGTGTWIWAIDFGKALN